MKIKSRVPAGTTSAPAPAVPVATAPVASTPVVAPALPVATLHPEVAVEDALIAGATAEVAPIAIPAEQPNLPMTQTETAIVKRPEGVPAYVEESSEGLENAGAEGLKLPILTLMQGQSPEVTQGDCTSGDVTLSIERTKTLFTKDQEALFVPYFHFMQWIEWADRSDGGGILGISSDPKGDLAARSRRRESHTNSEGKEVQTVAEYHVFFVRFEGDDAPACLALARSKYKKGSLLLQLALRRGGKYPLYAGKYSLGVMFERNKRNGTEYWNFDIKNAGWAEQDEYESCKVMYSEMKVIYDQMLLTVQIDGDEPSNEEVSKPTDDATAAAPAPTGDIAY